MNYLPLLQFSSLKGVRFKRIPVATEYTHIKCIQRNMPYYPSHTRQFNIHSTFSDIQFIKQYYSRTYCPFLQRWVFYWAKALVNWMLNRQFCPIQVHILEICNDNNKHETRHIEYKSKVTTLAFPVPLLFRSKYPGQRSNPIIRITNARLLLSLIIS